MKCWLASKVGFGVSGIDIAPKYIKLAKKIFPGFDFKQKDALKYKSYGKFDVIYMYSPICDVNLLERLVSRVIRQMKKGSYLCGLIYARDSLFNNLSPVGGNWNIWKK